MEELTVIDVTSDAIIAVSKDGNRFSISVDADLRNGIQPKTSREAQHATPREIQTLLRSGLTVAEVAIRLSEHEDNVARFEAPIAAELAFVLERALAVPVTTHSDDEPQTFGDAISSRIAAQGGAVSRWQAYRIDDEWVVGAVFHVGDVAEDATWAFDPRKLTLVPTNSPAVRVSKADAVDAALFPPLRVVAPTVAPQRFDSGEFEPVPQAIVVPLDAHRGELDETESIEQSRSLDDSATVSDLLDDLQRRRGERNEAMSSHPSSGSIPVITPEMLDLPDVLSPVEAVANDAGATDTEPSSVDQATESAGPFIDETPSQRHRRTRASMPTWDEIVFGTRPDAD